MIKRTLSLFVFQGDKETHEESHSGLTQDEIFKSSQSTLSNYFEDGVTKIGEYFLNVQLQIKKNSV